jgi:hypothetical protein
MLAHVCLDTLSVYTTYSQCFVVDGSFPGQLGWFIHTSVSMLANLAAIVWYTPAFIVPSAILFGSGIMLGQVYMRAQLSVKREMANAKAPVLGILNGAISGLGNANL